MSYSKLYRFIKNEVLNENNVKIGLEIKNFRHKSDKSQKNYFLYELEVNNRKTLVFSQDQRYLLQSHHISFYEIEDDKNPCLSQYHYTAYFTDQENKHYQLHIYFDHQDKLVTTPIFSIQEESTVYRNLANADFSENLIHFARQETVDMITRLRQLQRNKIEYLEQQYIRFESELSGLSIDLMNNRDKYLQLLNETLEVLNLLSQYQQGQHVDSLIRLFKRIKESITLLSLESFVIDHQEPELSVEDLIDAVSEHVSDKDMKTKESPDKLIELATQSRDVFLAAKKEGGLKPNDTVLNAFLNFHINAHNALFSLDDNSFQIKVRDLQKTQKLIFECTKQGSGLLELLLIGKQFQLAQNLAQYLDCVQERMMQVSLVTNNAALLDFVLTHGNIPINTFTVKNNLTPVLFCFNQSKTECFSVLLKHGASLMVQAADGLPIAHHILSEVNHPFQESVLNGLGNHDKAKLYQTIIIYIDNYLETKEVSEAQKKKLETALNYYGLAVPILKEFTSLLMQRLYEKSRIGANKLSNRLNGMPVRDLVLADKDVQEKFGELNKLNKLYLSKLSKSEKMQELRESSKAYANLDKLIDIFGIDNDNLKAQTLYCLNNFIKIMTLKLECLELRKIIKKPSFAGNIKSQKKQDKALGCYKQNIQTINELMHSSGFFDEKTLKMVSKSYDTLNTIQSFIHKTDNLLSTITTPHKGDSESSDDDIEGIDFKGINFLDVATSSSGTVQSLGIFSKDTSKLGDNSINEKSEEHDTAFFNLTPK